MATLNLSSLGTSSMSTMRELEKFLKVYNAHISLGEKEARKAVFEAYDGMLSVDEYRRLVKMAKSLTQEKVIPDMKLWNAAKQEFREIGNSKIAEARKTAMEVRQKKAKIASLKAEKEKTSVYRAEKELDKAERAVKLSKGAKIALSVALAIGGAVALPLLLSAFAVMSGAAVVLGAIAGASLGAMGGVMVGERIENGSYNKLNKQRKIFDENDKLIRELEDEIGRAEEEIRSLEDQYETDIESTLQPMSKLDKEFTPEPIIEEGEKTIPEEESEVKQKQAETETQKKEEVKEKTKEETLKYNETKAKNMTGEDILNFVNEAFGEEETTKEPKTKETKAKNMSAEDILDFVDEAKEKEEVKVAPVTKAELEEVKAVKKEVEKPEKKSKEKEETALKIKEQTSKPSKEQKIGKDRQLNSGKELKAGKSEDEGKMIYLDESQYEDITNKEEKNGTMVVIPVTESALTEIKNQIEEEKREKLGIIEEEKQLQQKYLTGKKETNALTSGNNNERV